MRGNPGGLGLAAAVLWLLLWAQLPLCAQRWQLAYFYDRMGSNLDLQDLRFVSPSRGVAIGVLTQGRSTRPVSLTTGDGGASWALNPLPEAGASLFFLNESAGYMAAPGGVWKSADTGRSWFKLSGAIRGLRSVYFLDENRGWAAGEKKGVYETADGGKNWRQLPILEQVNSSRENTVFRIIAFADGRNGIIIGHSTPPEPRAGRRGTANAPEWMGPAPVRRERPRLMIALQTNDGGASWKPSTASVFGTVARVVFPSQRDSLALFQFFDEFSVPAEVVRMSSAGESNARVFGRANLAVTDLAATRRGTVLLAAVEPPGKQAWGPVPGKLKVLRSADMKEWEEMDVDYRAVARRAVLSVVDEQQAWLATDTGMILRLRND